MVLGSSQRQPMFPYLLTLNFPTLRCLLIERLFIHFRVLTNLRGARFITKAAHFVTPFIFNMVTRRQGLTRSHVGSDRFIKFESRLCPPKVESG